MPTPQEEAKAKQDAIEKANADAAETYKAAVGKSFTNGKLTATVVSYVPSMLLRGYGPRQCFQVNKGSNIHPFLPCKEFIAEFKPLK